MAQLPGLYDLPWSRRQPMFPATSLMAATGHRSLTARSMGPTRESSLGRASPAFGRTARRQDLMMARVNWDSKVPNTPRCVFGGGPARFPHVKPSSIRVPGPESYALPPSVGMQPSSPLRNSPCVKLNMGEGRWDEAERRMRSMRTPGPGTYLLAPRQ
jgi:hypothetical protein